MVIHLILPPYCLSKVKPVIINLIPYMSLLFRRIDGETRIGIFASRDIKKGEHLTYDYQYGCLEFVYMHNVLY